MNIRYLVLLTVLPCLVACTAPAAPSATPSRPAPTLTATAPVPNTVTSPPSTATLKPTATLLPTQPPAAEPNDAVWQQLQNANFRIVFTTSIVAANGYYYAVYQVTDATTPDPFTPCTFLVYRWAGQNYDFIERVDTPYTCDLVNWDTFPHQSGFNLYFSNPVSLHERQTLNLNGYWSDINKNGLPEFTTNNYDGCAFCDIQDTWYSYYEIRDEAHAVVDISPGLIIPGHILHTEHPLTIYASDFIWYDQHAYIMVDRIYHWDVSKYVDISIAYTDEYRAQAQEAVTKLQQLYGQPFTATDTTLHLLWTIPILYNEIDLPQSEGLEKFLEVTNPIHWPGTSQLMVCWLQLVRADAQKNAGYGLPFEVFPLSASGTPYPLDDYFAELASEIDTARFDVSACK